MIKITGESKEKDCKISIETTFEKLSSMYDTGMPNSYVGYYKELPYRRYSNIIVESTDETNFDRLFRFCDASNIYFKSFNTSQAIGMDFMFDHCDLLQSLDLSTFNTSNAKYMSCMFIWCKSLMSLDLSNFNTSNVTKMDGMFDKCEMLYKLDISSFDFSKVNDTTFMFGSCSSLTDLKFGKNFKTELDLSWSPLSHESALSVINGLTKVNELQYITFSKQTYATLSEEEIKKATDKNWLFLNDKSKALKMKDISYNIFKDLIPTLLAKDSINRIILNKETYYSLTESDKKTLNKNGFKKIMHE